MRVFILFLMHLCYAISLAQNAPIVKVVTARDIFGLADFNSTVHIDTNTDGVSDFNLKITGTDFHQFFTAPLSIGSYVIVWGESLNGVVTSRVAYIVNDDSTIISNLLKKSDTETHTNSWELNAVDPSRADLKDTYKASIWNTVFSIPIVRANLVKNDPWTEANVSLFTSIGAGYGYSKGRLEVTRNHKGEVIDKDFYNTFGVHVGVLYSSASGDVKTNVIAPVITLSLLDIGVGVGYEAGTITENQKRIFFTFSYQIPLYRLTKSNHRVRLRTLNPIESRPN